MTNAPPVDLRKAAAPLVGHTPTAIGGEMLAALTA